MPAASNSYAGELLNMRLAIIEYTLMITKSQIIITPFNNN